MAEGEEEHVVLILSDLEEVASGGFQDADVLTLLSRALETEDGDFLADQRVQKFHPAILTLSAGFGPPGPEGPIPATTTNWVYEIKILGKSCQIGARLS